MSEQPIAWDDIYLKMELWDLIEQARRAGRWPYPEQGQP